MNKKGFLLGEQTLKIIIAVICLLLLAFLLFMIYSSLDAKHKLEQAKSSMEMIELALDEAKQNGEAEVVILGPTVRKKLSPAKVGEAIDIWWVIAFPAEKVGLPGTVTPKTCVLNGWENCLCICESNFNGLADLTDNACDKIGICTELDKKAITEYEGFSFEEIRAFMRSPVSPIPIFLDEPPVEIKIEYMEEGYKIIKRKD